MTCLKVMLKRSSRSRSQVALGLIAAARCAAVPDRRVAIGGV